MSSATCADSEKPIHSWNPITLLEQFNMVRVEDKMRYPTFSPELVGPCKSIFSKKMVVPQGAATGLNI